MSDPFRIDGQQYYIYEDNAYVFSPWMQRSFLTPFSIVGQQKFNAKLSSHRVPVEHNYCELNLLWCSQVFT